MSWRRHINIPGLLTIGVILALWEGAVDTGLITFDYFPAPSAIGVAFAHIVGSGKLFVETLHTLNSMLIGWVIACLLGIGLGLTLGLSPVFRRYSMATFEVLRPMPAIAFLPLALLLFSFSLKTELVVIVYASLWPVMINSMGGVAAIGGRLYDVGRTLHLSRGRVLFKVLIPAAAPAILVGCRLGLGTALVMAIIAEMIGNPHGLGFAIVRELESFRPANMFAYVIFVGLLGVVLNNVLVTLNEHMFPGYFARTARHA
jgi:sulfonate transport system permease protein